MDDDVSAKDDAAERVQSSEQEMMPATDEWCGEIRRGGGSHEILSE
jgi:hypothetical protein